MKNKLMKFYILIVTISFLLVGCMGGPSPEEQIYETLEKVVSLEKNFEEQQAPLIELEKQERSLYDEILALGMKEFEKIVTLSDEALAIVDQREERLNSENESIKSSKEEFQKVEQHIEEIKDEKVKEEANELVSIMNQRYESYGDLYSNYNEAIKLDRQLYEMFKNEKLTLEELEAQITSINETYEKVVAANDTFNSLTEQYNKAKVGFYESAGLEVVYKEE
ncbi:YkyA family protein [Fredinandcohnia sp. 179-A 10B2 NHS]|uniref:YkyA family protein n=1 Tax=Fredinandcohnia sp. 179-A 10B2 NHS TaxID=3235176 RepID=UPI0039A2A163